MANIVRTRIINGPSIWGLIQEAFIQQKWIEFSLCFFDKNNKDSIPDRTFYTTECQITGLNHGKKECEWIIFGLCHLYFNEIVEHVLRRTGKEISIVQTRKRIRLSGTFNTDRRCGKLRLILPI